MLEWAKLAGLWNDYYDNYMWWKLVEVADTCGYEFDAHDSLEDVKATLHVFREMVK
jgi:DNA polymerase-3 subunit epsilon